VNEVMKNGGKTEKMRTPGPEEESGNNILIIGNMQSGKTSIFKELCGDRSYRIGIPLSSRKLSTGRLRPGGRMRSFLHGLVHPESDSASGHDSVCVNLLDTPGTSTLFVQGEEDMIVRDALIHMRPKALLVVADAKNLRRSLALLAHAAEFGLPTVIVVNMQDEALRYGISIDHGLLSSRLGISVIPATASEGMGISDIEKVLSNPSVPRKTLRFGAGIEKALNDIADLIKDLENGVSARGMATLLVSGDTAAVRLVKNRLGQDTARKVSEIAESINSELDLPFEVIANDAAHIAAGSLVEEVVTHTQRRRRYLDVIGTLSHHPLYGILIAAVVVILMYLFVGLLGATVVVDAVNTRIFEQWLVPLAGRLFEPVPWEFVTDALVDPSFGLVTSGLFLAFGLVMPVLFFFYFAFNILIESGYLPRLSILLDRVFRIIGLNGRGILPITMGFSCITMALITTRMLETRKERIIASFVLLLGTPCAPLLSVMLVILADMSIWASVTVFGIILIQSIAAGMIANRIIPGFTPDFIMQVPPMRIPKLKNIFKKTFRQTGLFLREAVPLFLLASFVIFIFQRAGLLDLVENAARPLIGGFLGLPDESVHIFIRTLIRRESGAAELNMLRGRFDNVQLVVTCLIMTFVTPCMNAIIVLMKERGVLRGFAIMITVSVYAFLVGAALNFVCRWTGVTFT